MPMTTQTHGCDAHDRDDRSLRYRKLKDVRGFFGLSENGFRLYEQMGLCHPKRDPDNGYRVCSLSDAVLMCNSFNYTRLGLSLKQTANLLVDGTMEQQLDGLRDLDERLANELEELLARKRRVEREIRLVDAVAHNPLHCEVVSGVSLLAMPIHSQGLDMGPGYDEGCAWWACAPYVCAGLLVELDDAGRAASVLHGPVADQRDVARLGLPTGHAVHFCMPERRYVHAFVTLDAEGMPGPQTYGHVWAFMRDQGLQPDGRCVLHRLVRHQGMPDGRARRHDEVFVPVAQ